MIKIPLEALKDKGEDNADVMPEPGDEVMLGGAKGIFKGLEGDMAMVELQEIGGVPVSYAEDKVEKKEECEKEPCEADLMKMAKAADKEAGYED